MKYNSFTRWFLCRLVFKYILNLTLPNEIIMKKRLGLLGFEGSASEEERKQDTVDLPPNHQ